MDSYQIGQLTKVATDVLLNTLLTEKKVSNSSPKTISFYKGELGLFIRWLKQQGVFHVDEITTPIIRCYISEISTHRNKGGAFSMFRAIRHFLNFYEFEYEPVDYHNPIKKVRMHKNNSQPLEGIEPEDVLKLISVCSGKYKLRDIALYHCLVSSGCRANELMGLDVDDVNIVTGIVELMQGKGDKSRYVFFGREARKALRRYLAYHPTDIQALWLTGSGERLTYEGLRHLLKKHAKQAELKRLPRLHDFRRCMALSCYRKGVSLFDISLLLGHTSPEVTRRYLNINIDDLKLAHSKGNPLD